MTIAVVKYADVVRTNATRPSRGGRQSYKPTFDRSLLLVYTRVPVLVRLLFECGANVSFEMCVTQSCERVQNLSTGSDF